jgi:type VI protein secretion system component Hcp
MPAHQIWGAEDVKLTKGAPLQKGKFTWVTEKGRQERYIIATCGNYTVTWNFR